MLSLWPAGLPSNAKGTVDWAGGLINWNSPYMKNGYYYAMVSEVKVDCYSPPSGSLFNGGAAYTYTNVAGTNNTVGSSKNIVVLKSLQATGDNPDYCPNCAANSGTSTASASAQTATAESIPGVVGAGDRGETGTTSNTGSGTGSSAGSSASNLAGSSGFSQGTTQNTSGAAGLEKSKIVGGSVFAILVAVAGLLAL